MSKAFFMNVYPNSLGSELCFRAEQRGEKRWSTTPQKYATPAFDAREAYSRFVIFFLKV
jgi:hypothetical protein